MSTPITGLSHLIDSYKADPEKTGNSLAKFLMNLLTHSSVKNKIIAAAGSDAKHISMSLDDLVEEVRQEAIAACLVKFRDPAFQVMTDIESAKYVFTAVKFASLGLVDRHLGSKKPDGKGRSKGLQDSPFKWGTEETDPTGHAAVRSMGADAIDSEAALGQSDIRAYLDSIQDSDQKLHRCLTLLLEGFTQSEIAAVMAVNERTIRNYLQRAKDAIPHFVNS